MGFVDRYASLNTNFSDDIRTSFLESAFGDALNRCVSVEIARDSGAEVDFSDQVDTPYADSAHPLFDLALWPDRFASIGKDYAF